MDQIFESLRSEFLQSLGVVFKSEDYSDFKIICGSETHKIHKAIVFPQSEYFTASCRFEGKEAENAEITLQDDEPEHVKAMVYYFYHLNYLVPRPTPDASTSNEPEPLSIGFQDPSFESINDGWGNMNTLVYKKGKKVSRSKPMKTSIYRHDFPCLVFHAKMYALADKYNIKGLKLLAKELFTDAAQGAWLTEELPAAIRVVFETTLDTDMGLRDPLVDVLLQHSEHLDNPEVEAAVKDTPGLAYQLLKKHRLGY